MKHLLLPVLLIPALIITNTAFATVDSVDVLIKTLIEKQLLTEEEAAAVRAEIANTRQDEEENRKSFTVASKRPIKVTGYLQSRYIHTEQVNTNDTLEVRRARLAIAGDATSKVDFKLQVDFAGSRKGLTSADLKPGTDPGSGSLLTKSGYFGKPTLLDAVIGYKLTGESRISVGQFKIPFGLENLTSSTNLDTINRSQVTEALVPGRDIGAQGRDIGVQYSGVRALSADGNRQLEYYVGLFDGAGINTGDDNDQKDLAARVVLKPGLDGFSLGLARYDGSFGQTNIAHDRTGTEFVYLSAPWKLQSEYIWGNDGAIKKNGWYALVVRQLTPATQAVVRYDRLDPNTAKENDVTKTWTVGANCFLNKDGYTRIQLNFERKLEEGTQVPNDLLLAQFQVGF